MSERNDLTNLIETLRAGDLSRLPELTEVLQRRVEEKVRFRGEDELAPEADLG